MSLRIEITLLMLLSRFLLVPGSCQDFCDTAHLEQKSPRDSLNQRFLHDSLEIVRPKLIRPQLRIDSRQSSFEKQSMNIYGYEAGALFRDKLRLALGYYHINTELPSQETIEGTSYTTTLAIDCGHLNTEILYYTGRYLSLGFPWEFAFGTYDLTRIRADGQSPAFHDSGFLSFTNFGLSFTFTPIRFIGLKALAGYRKSIYPSEKRFGFNGVFSSIGLNLDIREFTNDIKMYRLKKKYHRHFHGLATYVDLLAD